MHRCNYSKNRDEEYTDIDSFFSSEWEEHPEVVGDVLVGSVVRDGQFTEYGQCGTHRQGSSAYHRQCRPFLWQLRFVSELEQCAERAATREARFADTLLALLLTLLLAMPWGFGFWWLGQFLDMSSVALAGALATGLQNTAVRLFLISVFLLTLVPHGLAEAHFNISLWSAMSTVVDAETGQAAETLLPITLGDLGKMLPVIGVMVAFSCIGIGWSKVQFLAAAITVGLGFGLQEIFVNMVSGLNILFERQVRVGDVVTIGSTSGRISRIRIRATTIVDWHHKELIIPNKEFVTGQVVNWSLTSPMIRVDVPVDVAYGSNIDQVLATLRGVADDHPLVLKDPKPSTLFVGFGDSTLNFELRAHIADSSNSLGVRHDLLLAIDRLFREKAIEIAFPQRDIHIRSGLTFAAPNDGEKK